MSLNQSIRIPGHVILDPENDKHVALLADAFCKARWSHLPGSDECDPLTRSSMQAALRSLIAPPKPPEPIGKYAEVEDHRGYLYFLDPMGDWRRADNPVTPRRWADIDAVKVLSRGVS